VVIGCHHLSSLARIIILHSARPAEFDLAKAIHTMIRVLDEARSIDFYSKAFSLEIAQRLDFETFTLIYLSNADTPFEVELTVNKGRQEPYALGDGYGHLAVSVADLDSEHDRLGALGLNPKKIVEFNRDGSLIARFFFIEDPDGYKIEVLQRGGRFQ
jgi:lactoylglutathione lyase